jgi:hypothetical protein
VATKLIFVRQALREVMSPTNETPFSTVQKYIAMSSTWHLTAISASAHGSDSFGGYSPFCPRSVADATVLSPAA